MKATQCKAPPLPPIEKKPCVVCKTLSHGYGFVEHGNGVVCSKACDEAHKEVMYERHFPTLS